MDLAQRGHLAFVLTLIGGIVGLIFGLFFGAMGYFFAQFFDYAARSNTSGQPIPPAGLFVGLFGFFAVVAIAGGIVMLVCAPRLRTLSGESRGYAIGAIVGGAVCFLGGNVIAAGLGIAGGIVALTSPMPAQGGAHS